MHVQNGLALKQLVGQRSEFAPSQIQHHGRFVIGGPQGGALMTGRKITVEMFGSWGAHAHDEGASQGMVS